MSKVGTYTLNVGLRILVSNCTDMAGTKVERFGVQEVVIRDSGHVVTAQCVTPLLDMQTPGGACNS